MLACQFVRFMDSLLRIPQHRNLPFPDRVRFLRFSAHPFSVVVHSRNLGGLDSIKVALDVFEPAGIGLAQDENAFVLLEDAENIAVKTGDVPEVQADGRSSEDLRRVGTR